MGCGSHSMRSAKFRLAQGTVTLFSNFTPQRGKGTKHNLVSLSSLCILNLIDDTRLNLNFFIFFTIWNVFVFLFFRDWWWYCFLRVCVLDLVWLVFPVDVFTVCCGSFVWWWSFDVLNLGVFSPMVQRNMWWVLWRVRVSEVWMSVLESASPVESITHL